MFRILSIKDYDDLIKWVKRHEDNLILQEDRTGHTLTIEVDTGAQIIVWGSDEDILVEAINHIAESGVSPSLSSRPTKVIEKKVIIRETESRPTLVPLVPLPDQGYVCTHDSGFETFERIPFDKKEMKFKNERSR